MKEQVKGRKKHFTLHSYIYECKCGFVSFLFTDFKQSKKNKCMECGQYVEGKERKKEHKNSENKNEN